MSSPQVDLHNYLDGIDRHNATTELVDERLALLLTDKSRVGKAGGWIAGDLWEFHAAYTSTHGGRPRIVPADFSGDPCITALIAGDDAELGRLVREAVIGRLRQEAEDEIDEELDDAGAP